MSNEVTEYLVSRGELLRADNLRPAEVNRLVDAEAYRALEAECEKWHQQFNCMQLQRDHHRDKAKALAAELAAIKGSADGACITGAETQSPASVRKE